MSVEGLGRGLEVKGGRIHRITFSLNLVFTAFFKNSFAILMIYFPLHKSNCVLVVFIITNEAALFPLVDEELHRLLLDQVDAHHYEAETDEEVDNAANKFVRVIVVCRILSNADLCSRDVIAQTYGCQGDEAEVESFQKTPLFLTAPHFENNRAQCEIKKKRAEHRQGRHPLNGRRPILGHCCSRLSGSC